MEPLNRLAQPSWREQLRKQVAAIRAAAQATAAAPRVPDPWEALLVDLTGETHDDDYERVPTYVAFEHLGMRGAERHSGKARRLARAMRQLGWQTTRVQPLRGSYQRVRGFVRPATHAGSARTVREHDGGSVG